MRCGARSIDWAAYTVIQSYSNPNPSVQEAIAAQQEIGTDLEQVEVLQKKFDDFKGDLKANEVRYTAVIDLLFP